jgi:hypothetical protein
MIGQPLSTHRAFTRLLLFMRRSRWAAEENRLNSIPSGYALVTSVFTIFH